MNYSKHYDALIERGRTRILFDYYETHHIVPRCLGGNDDETNLVKLTPEEHYLAHQLLCKIHKNNPKLLAAAMMMCANRKGNKVYGWLRRRHSQAMSELQTGEKNSQFGTKWIYSDIEKKSVRIPKEKIVPNGWLEGRKFIFEKEKLKCKFCNKEFEQKGLEIFCSNECKVTSRKSDAQKIINENLEDIIDNFVKTKSITKTLINFGITGRKGNTYLSNILKERGFEVLKRRNSYASKT
jgi:hypothetical protein